MFSTEVLEKSNLSQEDRTMAKRIQNILFEQRNLQNLVLETAELVADEGKTIVQMVFSPHYLSESDPVPLMHRRGYFNIKRRCGDIPLQFRIFFSDCYVIDTTAVAPDGDEDRGKGGDPVVGLASLSISYPTFSEREGKKENPSSSPSATETAVVPRREPSSTFHRNVEDFYDDLLSFLTENHVTEASFMARTLGVEFFCRTSTVPLLSFVKKPSKDLTLNFEVNGLQQIDWGGLTQNLLSEKAGWLFRRCNFIATNKSLLFSVPIDNPLTKGTVTENDILPGTTIVAVTRYPTGGLTCSNLFSAFETTPLIKVQKDLTCKKRKCIYDTNELPPVAVFSSEAVVSSEDLLPITYVDYDDLLKKAMKKRKIHHPSRSTSTSSCPPSLPTSPSSNAAREGKSLETTSKGSFPIQRGEMDLEETTSGMTSFVPNAVGFVGRIISTPVNIYRWLVK